MMNLIKWEFGGNDMRLLKNSSKQCELHICENNTLTCGFFFEADSISSLGKCTLSLESF